MMRKSIQFTAVLLFLLAFWSAASGLLAKPFLPGPAASLRALFLLHTSGRLWTHGMASLSRILFALVLGFIPASLFGLAAGRSRRLDALISPFAYVFYPLPKIAFLPVIMLFFGIGEAAKIVLIAFIIFFQILVSARDAARKLPQSLMDSVRSFGAGPLSLAIRVVIPGCLPELFTALRVSLGSAVAVLFISETFATETGLGFLIMDAWTRIAYPEMYAAIIALSITGFGLFILCDLAEWLFCPWKR